MCPRSPALAISIRSDLDDFRHIPPGIPSVIFRPFLLQSTIVNEWTTVTHTYTEYKYLYKSGNQNHTVFMYMHASKQASKHACTQYLLMHSRILTLPMLWTLRQHSHRSKINYVFIMEMRQFTHQRSAHPAESNRGTRALNEVHATQRQAATLCFHSHDSK